jgi:fatty acid desaturase
MVADLLSRYKHAIHWLHIIAVLASLCVAIPAIAWSAPFSPSRALLVFAIAVIAWCQNIGLMHEGAHRLPRGPRWLGLSTVRLLHAFGGLRFTPTRFAHLLHHAYLGTERDPDRAGYQATTTVGKRLRYLFMVGPLRARFAPVDVSSALDAMGAKRRRRHERDCRQDAKLVVFVQLSLIPLFGLYYPVVLAALIAANLLSNLREMAEHGLDGQGAYVDIRVSPVGVLLLSTPGFWFHGIHHIDPALHYFELPRHAAIGLTETTLPYVERAGAIRYLFTGR